ncbi:MAG: NAD(P)H-binding protein [Solirubrobacterales bacterium]
MRILLTGASGFIGSLLVPRLLAEGHDLRALAREPARVRSALAQDTEIEVIRGDVLTGEGLARDSKIEVIRGDVLTGEGLAQALESVDVAYYLIHSMESRSTGAPPHASFPERERVGELSFPERERLGAENFAMQARRAGVQRIVYLGGLLPRSERASRHLVSRAEVEEILFEHIPASVALRASIVIGARSRSFRLLVRLVERLPVLTLPGWHRFRTQPIDARDVIEMLAAAARLPEVSGRSLDIGGPEALTYEEMLQRIAELLLLSRPTVGLNVTMTPLAARLAAALAGEDPALILPLMEGLKGDLLPAESHAAELLGVPLHSFDDAVECALREWEAVEPLAAR